MFNKINAFLDELKNKNPQKSNEVLSPEIASAVLLYEVIKADGEISNEEEVYLASHMQSQFNLSAADVEIIIKEASHLSENATDFYQFTSTINNAFTIAQKIETVACLWKLALVDGKVDAIEEHIIRKVADLLNLRHSEYIQTKPKY